MSNENKTISPEKIKLYRWAFILAVFTIVYNVVEGILATYLGYEDESLTLFGFGADSFIEVISGLGIAHMVLRIQKHDENKRDQFEKTALQITGFAFYLLVLFLLLTSAYNIWTAHKPDTTFWGIVISLFSIAVMWLTIRWKTKIGKALNSEAIQADAACARVCIYMSVILLLSSALFELSGLTYVDSIATLGLAYFSFKEGKECFEKAAADKYCHCEHP